MGTFVTQVDWNILCWREPKGLLPATGENGTQVLVIGFVSMETCTFLKDRNEFQLAKGTLAVVKGTVYNMPTLVEVGPTTSVLTIY